MYISLAGAKIQIIFYIRKCARVFSLEKMLFVAKKEKNEFFVFRFQLFLVILHAILCTQR